MRQAAPFLVLLGLSLAPGKGESDEPPKQERKEEDRKAAEQHLKSIMVAMLKFHEVHGHFPPFASHDKQNKPLLSWRVLLLPYLEEGKVHREFKLDEAWDSAHNKALLKKMPRVYTLPGANGKQEHSTYLRVFVGADTVFHNNEGTRLREITDGVANTVMLVEAAEPVVWTKPDELTYFAGRPIPNLGDIFVDGFLAAYCDGSIRMIRNDFDERRMRLAIVRNDGFGLPSEPRQP